MLNVLLVTLFLCAGISLLEGVAQDPRLQGELRQGMLPFTPARKIEQGDLTKASVVRS